MHVITLSSITPQYYCSISQQSCVLSSHNLPKCCATVRHWRKLPRTDTNANMISRVNVNDSLNSLHRRYVFIKMWRYSYVVLIAFQFVHYHVLQPYSFLAPFPSNHFRGSFHNNLKKDIIGTISFNILRTTLFIAGLPRAVYKWYLWHSKTRH